MSTDVLRRQGEQANSAEGGGEKKNLCRQGSVSIYHWGLVRTDIAGRMHQAIDTAFLSPPASALDIFHSTSQNFLSREL